MVRHPEAAAPAALEGCGRSAGAVLLRCSPRSNWGSHLGMTGNQSSTIVSISVTYLRIIPPVNRTFNRTWTGRQAGSWGGCGARGRLCNPLPGGAGHQPPSTMTGVRGASLDWDRRGRVTPVITAQGLRSPVGASVKDQALLPSPRKPDAEPLRRKSLWQEPRWNADRCAHPALRMRGRARSARQKSLASVGVSLPMFLSRSFFSSSCPGPTRAFVRQRGLRAFHRAFAGLASAWITGISE